MQEVQPICGTDFCREVLGRHDLVRDQKPKLHIGYGANQKFIRFAGISMTSILQHNPQSQFEFHLIADSVPAAERQRLTALTDEYDCRIHLYLIGEQARQQLGEIATFQARQNQPQAAYYRLYLHYLLQDVTAQVLYLDSDVVCIRDWQELACLAPAESVCAAVEDLPEFVRNKKKQMALKSERYFNSGVLWMNTRQWVTQRISEQVIEFLLHTRTTTFDQDALNIVLAGKVHYLDPQWNCLKDRKIRDADIPPDCVFLHYIGGEKPWHFPYPHRRETYYYQYARQSLWKDRFMEYPHTYMMWREVIRMAGRSVLRRLGIS